MILKRSHQKHSRSQSVFFIEKSLQSLKRPIFGCWLDISWYIPGNMHIMKGLRSTEQRVDGYYNEYKHCTLGDPIGHAM